MGQQVTRPRSRASSFGTGVAVADEGAAKVLDHMVIVKPRQPGEPSVRLLPEDGEDYLRALEYNLRGSYLWATSPTD